MAALFVSATNTCSTTISCVLQPESETIRGYHVVRLLYAPIICSCSNQYTLLRHNHTHQILLMEIMVEKT